MEENKDIQENIEVINQEDNQEEKNHPFAKIKEEKAYKISKGISNIMDKYMLDPIIGYFMPGISDLISQVLSLPSIFLALFKIKSIKLTLAMIYNGLMDALLGIVPYAGDVVDIFNRSYRKNQKLIQGFVDQDQEVIKKVNKSFIKSIIGIIILIVLIYFAIILIGKITSWIIEQGQYLYSNI